MVGRQVLALVIGVRVPTSEQRTILRFVLSGTEWCLASLGTQAGHPASPAKGKKSRI